MFFLRFLISQKHNGHRGFMSEKKNRIRVSPSIKILLGFMMVILLGAFFISLPISNKSGEWLNFIDAFLTSTSSVCVTGLLTVDMGATFTLFGQIVILVLIQIGGLGIVAVTSLIFLILGKKIKFSNRVALKESLNRDSIQGVVKFIKKVIWLTLMIEFVGTLALLFSTINYTGSFWRGLFVAIFLSASSFCNAGIDILGSENSQFLSYSPYASDVLMLLPIMLLTVIGGIGFVVMIDGIKSVRTNQHARVVLCTTLVLILGSGILFLIFEWNNPETIGNMSVGDKILNAFFQSVSTRSGGASTFSQSAMTTGSILLTMFLMFIGGSPTSTAGGIKTTTFFILCLFLFKSPRNNGDIVYRDRKISANIISKAFKIVLYTIGILLISVVIISLIEGDKFSTISILFECVSAITTAGLNIGLTPLLAPASKIVVSLLMYVGRVGITTIALAISSKHTQVDYQVEYINTDIIVG